MTQTTLLIHSPSKYYYFLSAYIAICLLLIADVFTTSVGITKYGLGEGNPVGVFIIKYGIELIAIPKIIIISSIPLLFQRFWQYYYYLMSSLIIGILIYLAVIYNNVSLIMGAS